MLRKGTKDQRIHGRIRFQENITINGTIMVKGIDISEGGLYVHTGRSFLHGSVVSISFPLINRELTVDAKVQHNQAGIGMGLRFVGLTDQQKKMITEFLDFMASRHEELTAERATVLLVEDNDLSRRMNKSKLLFEGFLVAEASATMEALKLLNVHLPDIIVLALYSNENDAIQLLSLIRTTPEWKQIPVIVLSTCGTRDAHNRARKSGVDEFLIKMNTSPAKLTETVNTILRKLRKRSE
jgi:CheY-like chemotaxis protein